MTTHSTDELLKMLNSMDSVEDLEEFTTHTVSPADEPSFPAFLSAQMEKAGISQSDLIRNANIQRNYGYQILKGEKHPGRDKVISLCLALSLSLEETQRALTIASVTKLYPKRHRDSILIFCIQNKLSVSETNSLLDELQEATLN